MTFMQRIARVGQTVESGWDDSDVERVWQGLRRKRRRRTAGAAVVSVAGLAAIGAFIFISRTTAISPGARSTVPPPEGPIDGARSTGVRQPLRLADGSTVVAWNAGAEAGGAFAVVEDTPQRVVVNLAKGGARFDVVRRPQRVFRVQAGEVTISVLGPAFSVERVADRVGVVVTRGAVLVDWRVGTRRLAAGEEGWFPPLMVAPPATGPAAKAAAKETPQVNPRGARLSESGSSRSLARNEARTPDTESVVASPTPHEPAGASTPASATKGTGPAPAVVLPAPVSAAPDLGDAVSRLHREEIDAAALLSDADRARIGGRFEEGASLLRRLVRDYPNDQRAPLAAFSLGRLLLGELGRPAEAAQSFARARALAPGGPLAEDALARETEAWARAGDPDRAQARAAEYLRAYPNGRRAADVSEASSKAASSKR